MKMPMAASKSSKLYTGEEFNGEPTPALKTGLFVFFVFIRAIHPTVTWQRQMGSVFVSEALSLCCQGNRCLEERGFFREEAPPLQSVCSVRLETCPATDIAT